MSERKSLRTRLTWYVVVILLLLTAASGYQIHRGTLEEADELFNASLVQTARILDGLINREAIVANRGQLRNALQRGPDAHEYERMLFFVVLDASGAVLLRSRDAPLIPDNVAADGFAQFTQDGFPWLTFSLPASRDQLRIVVGERGEIRKEITEYIGSGLLVPLLLMLPLVLWLLWVIVGVALKPLQRVTQQVSSRNLNDLRPVDVTGVPREVAPLIDALNQMITTLDAGYTRERRFISDASHELRNPLASLLINVDNVIEECDNQEANESLQGMKTSIKRLSQLVSQLLQLSRYENPQTSYDFETIDLRDLSSQVVAEIKPLAQENQQKIELYQAKIPCRLIAVESLVHSLLSNLLDNAIKHAGEGATIRVTCSCSDDGILLKVEDSGPGLNSEEQQRALDRFYRAGDTNAPGSGLGLAIVKSIAEMHSGRVKVADSSLGGLKVSVVFQRLDVQI